jgi:hypothetical protein
MSEGGKEPLLLDNFRGLVELLIAHRIKADWIIPSLPITFMVLLSCYEFVSSLLS